MENQIDEKIVVSNASSSGKKVDKSTQQINDLNYLVSIYNYIRIRIRQFILFSYAIVYLFVESFNNTKSWAIRRMYWGRGSLYRTSFHIIIFSVTIISLLLSISGRITLGGDSSNTGLVLASGVVGNSDTLYQAGTAETVTAINPQAKNWPEYRHVVKEGETLEGVADQYGISTSTIKWANDITTDKITEEQVLTVPGIDGVLYEVEEGDTVQSIVDSDDIENATVFDILELNEIDSADQVLTEGRKIFILNGIAKIPVIAARTSGSGYYVEFNDPGVDVPEGTFVNPLLNCDGYYISRGVLPWHTGVDMPKPGGCWINATASGTVVNAEWSSYGPGFFVVIDHENGFKSSYFHGNGQFAVKRGDRVQAGQRIMFMGCTGFCTGTHLHFEMTYQGKLVNPQNYVDL